MRHLPPVDGVLARPELGAWLERLPRPLVRRIVQESVDALRERVRAGGDGAPAGRDAALETAAASAAARLAALTAPTLRTVLNATGVVLHTNLGRAALSPAALAAVQRAGRGFSNLEYDLNAGARTSRMDHVAGLMALVFEAEAAFAVNNNAAAVLLAVATLGRAGVVVSRGELVEIGDGFRLPEILETAGVPIREIGTTNRTAAADYAAAATPGCVFLKVHRSNFSLHGFVREARVAELAELASRFDARVVYDLGAGSVEPLERFGLPGEPDVRGALAAGAHVVTMSGDKLLGGPQAGLLAGHAEAIARLRRNPLARALRIDKLTLAALQATLLSYVSKDGAQREVPALRLILTSPDDIEARARRLQARLASSEAATVEVAASRASVGGGAFADLDLPSFEIRVRARHARAAELARRLRTGDPAVVARIQDETVCLDLRCVEDDEVELLAQAVLRALAAGEGEP